MNETTPVYMKYIIPVYTFEKFKKSKEFEEALHKFLDERIEIAPKMFEVFISKEIRDKEFHNQDGTYNYTRLCTTNLMNCYQGYVKITNTDFNSELGTYFIEVLADEEFDQRGKFYPRIFASVNDKNPDNKSDMVQIVGLDYIIEGEPKDENQSRA